MKDFTGRKSFPGTVGGPFEILVTAGNAIERIPSLLFFLILAILAFLLNGTRWPRTFGLLAVYITDWSLIALLPRLRVSHGPSKPQVSILALLRTPFALLPGAWFWVLQSIGLVLVLYGFWIEPQRLETSRQWFAHPGLPKHLPIRLLHFSDLHMDRLRNIDLDLIRMVDNLEPDLILFSGDALSYSTVDDAISLDCANYVFRSLNAPLGIYAVPGSPPVDTDEALERVYRGTSVRLLADECATVEVGDVVIQLIGVTCSHKPFVDAPKLESAIGQCADGDFRLLLYHSPDLAPEAALLGVDLQLSGHTHGGQVRIPFLGALYTSSLYGKRYEAGRYSIDGLTLYVSRGIGLEGMSAPRVRFLCRPEITLWELSSS